MTEHDVAKALEVWTLQNLLDLSIVLGILASGIAIVQGYYQSLEKHLSLRVSIELWRLFTVLIVDVLLVVVVLVGYLVLNPDIMADIKMAIPFYPITTILCGVALVLRFSGLRLGCGAGRSEAQAGRNRRPTRNSRSTLGSRCTWHAKTIAVV